MSTPRCRSSSQVPSRDSVSIPRWRFGWLSSSLPSLLLSGPSASGIGGCYSLALLSPPVVEGLFLANVTLFLMLPIALAWRWRVHAIKAGATVGAAIAIKPVLLPLVGWFLLTRRVRAAAISAAAAVSLIVVPWAAIGFDGMREYPRLLDRLEAVYGPGSLSVPAALSWLGTGQTARHLDLPRHRGCPCRDRDRRPSSRERRPRCVLDHGRRVDSRLSDRLAPLPRAPPRPTRNRVATRRLALVTPVRAGVDRLDLTKRSLLASCFALLVLATALLPALGRASKDLARGDVLVSTARGRATGRSPRSLSTVSPWRRL